MDQHTVKTSSAPKPFTVGFNVMVQVVLACVILVFINMALYHWHPPRTYLSQSDYYQLSDKTKNLLKTLKVPVEVIVFFQSELSDRNTSKVAEDIKYLLREYETVSPRIKVRHVDPDRDPVYAEKVAKEYSVHLPNVVIFACEKRSKVIQVHELIELEGAEGSYDQGNERMIKAFKGEAQFTSAIQSVLDEKQSKVYFLSGHGEGKPEDFDSKNGCSTVATYIKRDNLLIEKLALLPGQFIPKDCEALIICGPAKPIPEEEIQAIRDYLEHHGRVIFMLDILKNNAGLEKLLLENEIKLGNDIVMVKIPDPFGQELLVMEAPGSIYANHPVTESLRKEEVNTSFPVARSVDRWGVNRASNLKVTLLVQTPENERVWAETNLEKLQQKKAEFDGQDRPSPIPLAAAVEPNAAGEIEREGMRFVVFGCSNFIRNGYLSGGNLDLFMNALNWLLKREQAIGIAPKTPKEFSISLNVFQKRSIVMTEIVLIPFIVAMIGLMVWLARRK